MPTGERADWTKKVDYRRQRFERSYTRAPGTPAPEVPEVPEDTTETDTTRGALIVYQTPVLDSAGNLGFANFTMYETFPGGTLV